MIQVIQIGIGGFGQTLYRYLRQPPVGVECRLVAAVDPVLDRAGPAAAALTADGVPLVASLEDLDLSAVDLAVIASPIAEHPEQAIHLLEAGVNVLCEKPAAGCLADGLRMAAAAARSSAFLAIGFQWSYAEATAQLKAALAAGRFGAPQRFETLVLWPRDHAYYARSPWAGRRRDGAGRMVNDSPVANAAAHFLHHCLFLLGPAADAATTAVELEAELYRSNAIETFDSAALSLRSAEGVEIDFLVAHAARAKVGPLMRYRCSEATLHYAWSDGRGPGFVACFDDGRQEVFGDPEAEVPAKLWQAVAAAGGRRAPSCPITAALPHLAVVEALEAVPVHEVAAPWREEVSGDRPATVIPFLDNLWTQAWRMGRLPHHTGLAPWTVAPSRVSVPSVGL